MIADLDSSDAIRPNHCNEAINHRMLDRQLWTQPERKIVLTPLVRLLYAQP